MKLFKILPLYFIFSIVLLNKIYAQQDYVITLKKDTIYCKIRKNIMGNIQYRINENDKYVNIDSTLTEYFISKDTASYVFKRDPEHEYQGFVKWVKRGKVNLYAREMTYSTTNPGTGMMVNSGSYLNYYASKGNDNLTLLSSPTVFGTGKYRRKPFLDLFSDDIILQERFKNTIKEAYNDSTIVSCIEEYNKEYALVNSNVLDYLITKKNDTVKCRIKYESGEYLYKATEKSDYVKIDSAYTKGYFYARENIYFTLIAIPGQNSREFIKWLERGTINLFERTSDGDAQHQGIKYYWYISKNNGNLIPIKINAAYEYDLRKHKDQLVAFKNAISDDKNLLTEFNESFKDADSNTDVAIKYYIQQYNKNYLKSDKTGK